MICENCKHEIGPEDLKCPNCGADNPFAVKHAENMKNYGKAYGKTTQEVIAEAKKTGGLAKRAAILVVLVIACIVVNLISSLAYAEVDEEEIARADALKNAATYAEEADGFLERGEYVEYVSFLYAHELMNFPPEKFARFKKVTYVAREYYECITEMEEMILRSPDPDVYDELDTNITNFCRSVEGFYEVYHVQKDGEKDPVYAAYMEDIENELRAAMRVYFSMDEEELEEFLSLSQAKKGVKLEEVLRHE